MVKRRIIWTHRAEIELFEILNFYAERNKSKKYSKKLFNRFQTELSNLLKQSEIGLKTDLENVRGLIIDDFIIFYENQAGVVIVHYLWDCRQNPDSLKII